MVTPCMREHIGCHVSGLHRNPLGRKEEHPIAVEARDLIAQECSGLCSGFPINPNAQDEFLLLCLTKGFEIQVLGWQEQPELRRFHLWASMCIGNVLVHPLALKNKPFSFQRTANFVVTLVFFFFWFI